jgi:hypothetical protein
MQLQRSVDREKEMFKVAPALLNGATGEEIIPDASSDTAIIDALAVKVDPEKIKMLVAMGVLTAEEAGVITLRFKKTLEKKAREKEALSKVPAGDTGDASNVTSLVTRRKPGGDGSAAPALP